MAVFSRSAQGLGRADQRYALSVRCKFFPASVLCRESGRLGCQIVNRRSPLLVAEDYRWLNPLSVCMILHA